jgi:hypothetical protein
MSVGACTLSTMESRVYQPGARPDVLVTVDGLEYPGELRMWQRREDASWWANVNWSRGGQRYVDTAPASDVRPDETDSRAAL